MNVRSVEATNTSLMRTNYIISVKNVVRFIEVPAEHLHNNVYIYLRTT